MITLDQIRKKLAEAINLCGIPKAQIAKQLGISATCISQYLSGRSMPALDTFANLCKILDVDANEILCIQED